MDWSALIIAIIGGLAAGALIHIIFALGAIKRSLDELEMPSMFTQQLNRRLIEEHTRELKRFNERKH